MKYVNVELEKTALVIECPNEECGSQFVLNPTEGTVGANVGLKCIDCQAELIPATRKEAVLSIITALLDLAKDDSHAKIRLRVEIDE